MHRNSPLAEALAQSLKDAIRNGQIAGGKPLPAERELSEKFSVSRAMVRKAVAILAKQGWISVYPHCRPVVTYSDLEAADPAPAAKVDHISVWLWPYVDDFSVSAIFKGIQKGIHDSGLRLVVATAPHGNWTDTLEAEKRFLHDVAADATCAGGILWLLGGEESIAEIEGSEHPLVFIDRKPPEGFEGDFVGTENAGATVRAVQHLVQLGHRRIACVTNMDEVSTVVEREAGYRRALDEAGIRFDPDLVCRFTVGPGESESSAMERVYNCLFDLKDKPTAVFAVNDSIALQLIEVIERQGCRVPEDVSVVGFDGLLRWLPGGGRLTTVDQDFFRMGELAAELLLERLQGRRPRTYRHILLDAPLRVQGTTSPSRNQDELGPLAESTMESIA